MARPAGSALVEIPEVLRPVAADVEAVEAAFERILSTPSDPLREMIAHAGRFSGKRLRPALTCIAARAVGGAVTPDVATVAAIVELIHTATLVHDDVLDGALVRRKVATLNAIWGTDTAVLLGDVLFSRAYLAAARLADRHASVYLSEVVGRVLAGEIRQNRARHDLDLSEEAYRSIIEGKTASLYEAALSVGAHYAGADAAATQALSRFGHHLGMAFQIVDDRLDLAGDEETVGKSLGTDLREGKTTLPVILWLRSRSASERASARALVEEAGRDEGARAALVRRLREDGALVQADASAREEVALAERALERLPSGPSRDLLGTIARYVVQRVR
jgi:octaprenyl-diphosphate synthase